MMMMMMMMMIIIIIHMKMNLKETSMDKTNPAQDRKKW